MIFVQPFFDNYCDNFLSHHSNYVFIFSFCYFVFCINTFISL